MGRSTKTVHQGVVTGLAVLLFGIGCTRIDTSKPTSSETLPELELFGATVRYSRSDKPLFIIQAPRISRHDTEEKMLFKGGIIVDFFDREGLHNAILTSDEGDVYEKKNRLSARGNVVVKSDSGMILLTEELHYLQKDDRVTSDEFVTVITDNDSLTGVGFSAAPDLSDWVILNSSGATWRKLDETRKSPRVEKTP